MKRRILVAVVLAASLLPLPVFAQRKECEELKMEIAAKLDAKGVKNYTLTIVTQAEVKEGGQVVGTCEGGTKRIVYTRG